MAAVWFGARADLRRRRRAWALLVLMVGALGGAALTTAAGARRTESAYARFLERYGAFDVTVSTGGNPQTDRIFERLRAMPEVAATSRTTLFAGEMTAHGRTLSFPDVFLLAMRDAATPRQIKVVEGRLPDFARAGEAVVGYALAERLGIRPGDRVTVTLRGLTETGVPEARASATVTGIIVLPGGFETLTGRGFPSTLAFTPAFHERFHALAVPGQDNLAVALRTGEAGIAHFRSEVQRLEIPLDGPPVAISSFTEDVEALNDVPVVSLWAATALLALATAAIVASALARETAAGGSDLATLHALGLSRRGLFAVSMVKALGVGVAGAATAVCVGVLASPLMPLGVARIAEPDPGIAADWGALGPGAVATLAVVAAAAAVPALRTARRAVRGADRAGRGGRSALVAALSRAGMPPSMVAGVGLATAPAGRADSVPARSAALGVAFAVAAVATAVVFASSLARLTTDPRLSGYPWDAAVLGFDPESLDAVEAALPSEVVARAWRGTVFPLVDVDGLPLTAHASNGPGPSILRGRGPRSADEVALDPETLESLDKGLGDHVTLRETADSPGGRAGTRTRRMRVVGSFVVPRIPFQPNENPGQGVALTPEALASFSDIDFDAVFVRFRRGVDVLDGAERLKQATAGRAFAVLSPLQLGMVRNIARISAIPWVLGAVLGVVAVAALAHALLLAIRRRRKDLAVLKTLGFVGRQARATVAWLAVAIVAPGLAIGLPAGIAGGRWGWRLFAEQIVVVPSPLAPAVALAAVVPATLLVANVVAAFPARAAARTRAALVLRTE